MFLRCLKCLGHNSEMRPRLPMYGAFLSAFLFLTVAVWLIWPWPVSETVGDGQILLAYLTFPSSVVSGLIGDYVQYAGWSVVTVNAVLVFAVCIVGIMQYAFIGYYLGYIIGELYFSAKRNKTIPDKN